MDFSSIAGAQKFEGGLCPPVPPGRYAYATAYFNSLEILSHFEGPTQLINYRSVEDSRGFTDGN